MGVYSLEVLPKGSEILVSYGKSWWKARNFLSEQQDMPNKV